MDAPSADAGAVIAELDRRFGIPGSAHVVAGNGGLPKVHVESAGIKGDMYLHGAQVTSWRPPGAAEVLFVSSRSHWQEGRAIRGGVPVCFPWFAARVRYPQAPMHGLVRTKAWQLESIVHEGAAIAVSMSTTSDADTRRWRRADFGLVQRVTFGAALCLELAVTNTGSAPLRFEEALHTYLRVGDIEQTPVHGFDGVVFFDKIDRRRKVHAGSIVVASETDRIHLAAPVAEVEDRVLRRRIRITSEQSATTVVWNPWVHKARALPDFGDDEWRHMICIETSNVADCAIELAPGATHRMSTRIELRD